MSLLLPHLPSFRRLSITPFMIFMTTVGFCAAHGAEPALPVGAKLVFEENFARAHLGDAWKVERGSWEIRGKPNDRHLFGAGDGGTIVCTRAIGSDMRIEYTAWSPHPGDRSVWLGFPEPANDGDSYPYRKGYLFQYGSYYSTKNAIQCGGKTIAGPLNAPLPKPDKRSRVVIQKQGITLQMFVDGKKVFDVSDRGQKGNRRIAGMHFGFYLWGEGVYFDDIRAYKLPSDKVEEPEPVVNTLLSFEQDEDGKPPASVTSASTDGCSATVINEPTFVYKPKQGETVVPDQCVRLRDPVAGQRGCARLHTRFEPIRSGQFEVELLARSYEGDCLEIALLGEDGSPVAAILIDEHGEFRAPDGGRQRTKLKHTIEYIHRGGVPARLWLQPQRWFTLRLGFDRKRNRFGAAIVNLFSGFYIDGISWVQLGEGLPMRKTGGAVAGLSIRTLDRAEVLIDNCIVYGPCGKTISGKYLDLPLRKLLGLQFPPRKDSFTLGVFSLKNMPKGKPWNKSPRKRRTPKLAFVAAGKRYSELMVRQVLLADSARQVERMLFHLDAEPVVMAQRLVKYAGATFASLDELYRVFGAAYVDSMNEERLRTEFTPAADALEAELTRLEAETSRVTARLAQSRKRTPPPAVAAALPDRSKHPLTWRDGHFRRNGLPDYYFPYHGSSIGALAPLLHIDLDKYVNTMAGYHAAWARLPANWIEKHGKDSDVWCTGRFGKLRQQPYHKGYGGNVYSGLNFWNNEVLRMMFDMGAQRAGAFAKQYAPAEERIKQCKIAAEGRTQPESGEAGFNPSAVKAFRAWLRKRYGMIEKLNDAWRATYTSFDEIDQSNYKRDKPSGLLYDFQRFRQDGYWHWIGAFMNGFRSKLSHVPIANDFNTPMGGYSITYGYDMTKMFETYDIVGCHSYDIARRRPTYRMLDSLRKAYGTPLGNQEWGLGSRMPRMFDEHAYFVHGLTDLFHAVAWGHSLWHCWYGKHPGWSEGFEFIEHRFNGVTLRYASGCFPAGMARCRRIGQVSLEVPTVTSPVAILESTASLYHGLSVRAGMLELGKLLEKGQYHYDYLFERPLLDGKQTLAGRTVVLAPTAICIPGELQDRLATWIRNGGVLAAVGPPGLLDRYGNPSSRLLRNVFPEAQWQPHSPRMLQWTVSGVPENCMIGTYGKTGRILKASLGKGWIYMFTDYVRAQESGALRVRGKTETLTGLLQAHMSRHAYSENGAFDLVIRRRPGPANPLWLYVVNPDFDRAVADEIVVAEACAAVDDVGLDPPFPVRFGIENGTTRVPFRLHPGEGTLLRLTPQ